MQKRSRTSGNTKRSRLSSGVPLASGWTPTKAGDPYRDSPGSSKDCPILGGVEQERERCAKQSGRFWGDSSTVCSPLQNQPPCKVEQLFRALKSMHIFESKIRIIQATQNLSKSNILSLSKQSALRFACQQRLMADRLSWQFSRLSCRRTQRTEFLGKKRKKYSKIKNPFKLDLKKIWIFLTVKKRANFFRWSCTGGRSAKRRSFHPNALATGAFSIVQIRSNFYRWKASCATCGRGIRPFQERA